MHSITITNMFHLSRATSPSHTSFLRKNNYCKTSTSRLHLHFKNPSTNAPSTISAICPSLSSLFRLWKRVEKKEREMEGRREKEMMREMMREKKHLDSKKYASRKRRKRKRRTWMRREEYRGNEGRRRRRTWEDAKHEYFQRSEAWGEKETKRWDVMWGVEVTPEK